MFYTVDVDEVGIVQRFGKYVRTTQPGLNFKLPTGIEKVTKVKVRRVYKEEFGLSTSREGDQRKLSAKSESGGSVALMLTGDLNVALVPWIVQYRIKDPYNFLFKVKDNRLLLLDMSEAAMSLVVGDRSVNEVISKREEIAVEARNILQTELDNAESGINVITIEMKKTNVPDPVQPSFIRPRKTTTRPYLQRAERQTGPSRLPRDMHWIASTAQKGMPQGFWLFILNTTKPRMLPNAGFI
jgi:membrane protease subunit HflK